jgi:hypothetical protein
MQALMCVLHFPMVVDPAEAVLVRACRLPFERGICCIGFCCMSADDVWSVVDAVIASQHTHPKARAALHLIDMHAQLRPCHFGRVGQLLASVFLVQWATSLVNSVWREEGVTLLCSGRQHVKRH